MFEFEVLVAFMIQIFPSEGVPEWSSEVFSLELGGEIGWVKSVESDIVSSVKPFLIPWTGGHCVFSELTVEQLYCNYYIFQRKGSSWFGLVFGCFTLSTFDWCRADALETFSGRRNEQVQELQTNEPRASAAHACALPLPVSSWGQRYHLLLYLESQDLLAPACH